MMKAIGLLKSVIIFTVVFSCANLNAQKKRDILVNRISAVTETSENIEDGQKPLKTQYTKYDVTGEVAEEYQYKNDGKFDSHVVYEYDSKGNKKKEIQYDQKGLIDETIEYEYDNDGNKIRETYFNARGQKTKSAEIRYSNGLKSERIVLLPNGKIKSKKKYTYEYQK